MIRKVLVGYPTSLVGALLRLVSTVLLLLILPLAVFLVVFLYPSAVAQTGIESAIAVDLVELVADLKRETELSGELLGMSLIALVVVRVILKKVGSLFYSIGN